VCFTPGFGRVIAETSSPYQRVTNSSTTRRYGKGLLPRRLLETPSARSGTTTSPSCIPPSAVAGGHRAGAGDRWRDGGTARECPAPPRRASRLETCGDRLGQVGPGAREHLPVSGPAAGAIPVAAHLWATALPEVAAAALTPVYGRGASFDGSDLPARPRGLFNRASSSTARRISGPAASSPTRAESPEAFPLRCTSKRCGCLREGVRHADSLYGWVPCTQAAGGSWTFRRQRTAPLPAADAARARVRRRGLRDLEPRWQARRLRGGPAGTRGASLADVLGSTAEDPGTCWPITCFNPRLARHSTVRP